MGVAALRCCAITVLHCPFSFLYFISLASLPHRSCSPFILSFPLGYLVCTASIDLLVRLRRSTKRQNRIPVTPSTDCGITPLSRESSRKRRSMWLHFLGDKDLFFFSFLFFFFFHPSFKFLTFLSVTLVLYPLDRFFKTARAGSWVHPVFSFHSDYIHICFYWAVEVDGWGVAWCFLVFFAEVKG